MSIKTKCILFIVCTFNTQVVTRFHPYLIEPEIKYNMTIMIDPAGDARYPGRTIEDYFERGLTLQCAEQLKKLLENEYPQIKIILTRRPGETVHQLQNANFANRLNVDLYLSIHFYQETEEKQKLYIYYFSYGNELSTKLYDLCFYPYDQAYIFNKERTEQLAQQIKNNLAHENYNKLFDVKGPYALPFKPLIGIKSPAIAIETSLKQAEDWKQLCEPIMTSLAPLITTYRVED